MYIKKLLFVFCVIAFTFIATSCAYKPSYIHSNSETTVAGNIEKAQLRGDAMFGTCGEPFTDEEIETQIAFEIKNGLIPEDCYVSRNGYYHIELKEGYLNYNFYTLPIIKNNQIYGELSLMRKSDKTVETARISEFVENNELNRVLKENNKKKFAMVYSEFSEYAIMEDNTTYTIYGFSPEIINGDKLYSAFDLTDNIISYESINEKQ